MPTVCITAVIQDKQGRIYDFTRAGVQSMYSTWPCTRSCTAVYTARVRGPTVYTCTMYRAHSRVHGLLCTWARTMYTAVCGPCTRPRTGRMHGLYTVVYTAVYGPCVHGCVCGRIHDCTRPCKRLCTSSVHFNGLASYARWVGILPHSWGKTPTFNQLKSKRRAR